jgi:serine/threonine protein kinase/dipeptidyl aminopeptidase/acylaminoacyl peptidase
MDAARRLRTEELFHRLRPLESGARARLIAEISAEDSALGVELQSLLAAHDSGGAVDRLVLALAPLGEGGWPADLTGTSIGRYEISELIAHGGMGDVYRARDTRLGREVALKFLSVWLSRDPSARDRFLVEARIVSSLDHPNICTLLESGETDQGRLFLTMPCYVGESLKSRLTRGPLPPEEAVGIALQIARGLAAAHERGIVHRDIKPANLMLTEGGLVKILDFGVAKLADVSLTQPAQNPGTVAYMSPEQVAGKPVDGRSDLWALGVVFHEMLTGRRPFSDSPVPEVPGSLGDIIARLLSFRAEDRYPDAPTLARDLEAWRDSASISGARRRAQSTVRRSGETRRSGAWLLGGALVAGGVIAAILTRAQPAPLVIGQRATVAAGPDLETFPSISPDGQMVTYTLATATTSQLFVQPVHGGPPVPVATELSGQQDYGAFSPDGTRLLFHGLEGLYVVPVRGGPARLIVRDTLHGTPLWGSWAPDGKRIAYVLNGALFIQSLDGTGRTALAEGVDLHSTAWSPDGHWIAFVSGNSSFYTGNLAPSAVCLVRAAGGPVISLTDSVALNTGPAWVPGKRSILFISDRDGGRDVYQLFLTRRGTPAASPVRITTGLNPERISLSADGRRMAWSVLTRRQNIWSLPIPARDSLPLSLSREETTGTQEIENFSISGDGQWLYYDSDRTGNMDIWRRPLRGGEPQEITTDPAADFQPAVSPDGREVAFHSMRTGNRDIFVVPAAGGTATRISTSRGEDNDASWSPDGQALIWTADVAGTSAWIARRTGAGSWGVPAPLPLGATISLRMLRWSPDGRWIFFSDSGGMQLWNPVAQERRRLARGMFAWFVAWSEDSRAVYGWAVDRASRRAAIVAVTVPEGKPRVLAYADDTRRQRIGSGFAVRNGRMYFTLEDYSSDVWAGEVRPR